MAAVGCMEVVQPALKLQKVVLAAGTGSMAATLNKQGQSEN